MQQWVVSVVRRKEKMEHVMGSVGQHMEYNKNAILTNQNRLDVKEQEMQTIKQDLQAKEQELDDTKRDLQATKDKLKEIQSQLKTAITEMERELGEVIENNKSLQMIRGIARKF